MPIVRLTHASDPLLAAYADLRSRNLTRLSGRFIAESPWVVERLLASDYGVESLLVAERMLPRVEELPRPECPIFVMPEAPLRELVGINFHRGVLACGLRKAELRVTACPPADLRRPAGTVCLALHDVLDQENVGGLIRTAAALGVQHVLYSARCADPFSRQALRVAMGHTFRLQLWRTSDFAADLAFLRSQGLLLIAAALSPTAIDARHLGSHQPCGLVLGNEGYGLPDSVVSQCDLSVQIPMAAGVDSLNVVVAGGILLHQLRVLD